MDDVAALQAQSADLIALLTELSDEEWARPSRCPGWSVIELAAHCEHMLIRLVGDNAEEVDGEPEADRSSYYDPRSAADDEAIKDRVVDEVGGRSPEAVLSSLREASEQALEGVRSIPADRVVFKSGRRMRYGDLVASRVLELGVHTMDIGHATMRGERIHPDAVAVITAILDGRLGGTLPVGMGWDPRTYVLTGTGRRRLEPNERFVLGDLAARFPLVS